MSAGAGSASPRQSDASPGRSRRWLWVALVLALAVRVVHATEVARGPFPLLHLWAQSDMHFFDHWAREIVAGDLWSAGGLRPYHTWHDALAREAYISITGSAQGFDEARGRALWERWLGENRLYQDAGYPYTIAGVYAALRRRPAAVWGLQSLLGLGCVALVFSLASSLYGGAAAAIAASLVALYGPLVFYEPVLLRAVSFGFLGLLALRAALAAFASERAWAWLRAGAAAGLAYLVRSTAVLAGVLTVVIGCRAASRTGVRSIPLGGAFLLGWLLAISPLSLRNLHEGAPPWAGGATAVVGFVRHNHAGYRAGGQGATSPVVARILAESEGRAWPALQATLATFEHPWGWPELLAAKFVAFWTPGEIPNNASYAHWKLLAPRTAAVTLDFVWIALAASVGLGVRARSAPGRALLLASIGAGVAVCVVFFNLSRFRLPVALLMAVPAGAGAASLIEAARVRSWKRVGSGLVAVTATAGLLAVAAARYPVGIRVADYGVANGIAVHLARGRAERGELESALRLLEAQLGTEPEVLERLRPGGPPVRLTRAEAAEAGSFAEVYAVSADLLARRGQRALSQRRRARARLYERIAARERAARRRPAR